MDAVEVAYANIGNLAGFSLLLLKYDGPPVFFF